MKFVVTNNIRSNRLLKVLLVFFYLQMLIFSLLNVFLEKNRWGLSVSAIQEKILGNEEAFLPPMEILSLVSELHIELFLYSFLLVMALVVFFRTSLKENTKVLVAVVAFASCLLNCLSPFLIFYGIPAAAFLKTVGFWGLTLVGLYVLAANLFYLGRPLESEAV